MFILVSTPLGLVTGGLSGSPWTVFIFMREFLRHMQYRKVTLSEFKDAYTKTPGRIMPTMVES